MIISHSHKFIFIKTRKTAGTSLEVALSKVINPHPKDILTPLSPENEKMRYDQIGITSRNINVPLRLYKRADFFSLLTRGIKKTYSEHMSAKEIKEYVPSDIWKDYYKFCFERNPIDFTVSLYFYHLKKSNIHNISLNEFVDKYLYYYSNFDLYSDKNRIIVDNVFKFEELDESVKFLKQKLKLNAELDLKSIKANSLGKNKKIDKTVLSDKSLRRIREIFAREYAYFYS